MALTLWQRCYTHLASLETYRLGEVAIVTAFALLLWALLVWLQRSKRTRFSKWNSPAGSASLLTNTESSEKRKEHTARTPNFTLNASTVTKNQRSTQDSPQGYYGYPKQYLLKILKEIGCESQDPSYVRGMAVYCMSAIANMGRLATGAYSDPSADGWEESNEDNVVLRHLSWDWANSSVKEVLKLTLNSASLTRRRRRASLHINAGWSSIDTKSIQDPDSDLPETHYFLLRRDSVMGKDITKLTATFSYRPFFRRRQYIEFSPLNLETFKTNPEGSWSLEDESVTLQYKAEFLSFEKACSDTELNIPASSSAWSQEIPQFDNIDWVPAIENSKLYLQEFETCAFLENEATSTQCWVFRLLDTKTIVVSIRGTQLSSPYDLALDSTRNMAIAEQRFTFGDDDPCKLDFDRSVESDEIAVAQGYWNAYVSIRSTLLEIVYQMSDNWSEEWSIVINGHSLGAAVGTICAFEFANRTLDGTGPRIESLTFAPVRTGTQAFVDCYDKLVPDSLRVINEEDYLGGEFLRNVYEHVRYELHCANNDSRTVTLPDSPSAEVEVCRHIMSRVSQTTSPDVPEQTRSILPTAIEHHDLGQYLYSTLVVISNLGEDEVSTVIGQAT